MLLFFELESFFFFFFHNIDNYLGCCTKFWICFFCCVIPGEAPWGILLLVLLLRLRLHWWHTTTISSSSSSHYWVHRMSLEVPCFVHLEKTASHEDKHPETEHHQRTSMCHVRNANLASWVVYSPTREGSCWIPTHFCRTLCVSVSQGFWFLDKVSLFCSPMGGYVRPAFLNPKPANHTPQQQHENTDTDWETETRREENWWSAEFFILFAFFGGFSFRFLSAGFVEGAFIVVERTYLLLLLRLLSCSSNSEVLSWPSLLLLLIQCSETPAASALSSPPIARELVCDSASGRATSVCKTHARTHRIKGIHYYWIEFLLLDPQSFFAKMGITTASEFSNNYSGTTQLYKKEDARRCRIQQARRIECNPKKKKKTLYQCCAIRTLETRSCKSWRLLL